MKETDLVQAVLPRRARGGGRGGELHNTSRADTESESGAAADPAAATPCASAVLAPPWQPTQHNPTTLTIAHWRRLLDGELLARASRLDRAVLLRRTYGVETLRCPQCDGRMRPLATITDPASVRSGQRVAGAWRVSPVPEELTAPGATVS